MTTTLHIAEPRVTVFQLAEMVKIAHVRGLISLTVGEARQLHAWLDRFLWEHDSAEKQKRVSA